MCLIGIGGGSTCDQQRGDNGGERRPAKLRDCPEHQDLELGGANPEALQEGIVLTRQHYSDLPTGLGLQVVPESALSWESV